MPFTNRILTAGIMLSLVAASTFILGFQDQPETVTLKRGERTVPPPASAEGASEFTIVLRAVGDQSFELLVNGQPMEAPMLERIIMAMQRRQQMGDGNGSTDRLIADRGGPRGPRQGSAERGSDRRRGRGSWMRGRTGPGRGVTVFNKPLDSTLIKEVMAVVADVDPVVADQLRNLQAEDDGETYRARMAEERNRYADLIELRQADPGMYALEVQNRQLTRRLWNLQFEYQAARENEKGADKALKELRLVVTEQFDVQTQIRQLELDRLEEQVARVQATLDQRVAQRDEIIERYIGRVSGKDLFGSDR